MSFRPLVSVIVPVHGTAWCLRQCLDSLLVQSLSDIEIVIVNDASPDEAGNIIAEYVNRDTRIRVVSNTVNVNLFESRLRGFEAATGDFHTVCDSDDIMPPKALEYLYNRALTGNADIVHGRARELGGKRSDAILYNCEPFRVSSGYLFVESLMRNIRGWNVWGKLFRKEVVQGCIKKFPRNTKWFQAEDIVYCVVLGLAARRYTGIDETVYLYRYSDFRDIYCEDEKRKRIQDQIEALAFLKNIVNSNSHSIELQQYFMRMSSHIMSSVLRTVSKETQDFFLEECYHNDLILVPSSTILSWRYHYDWITKNGVEEYALRLKSLWAQARRIGWKETYKRL